MIALEEGLAEGRHVFRDFVESIDPTATLVVLCHFDADGLSAGAVFGRGLPRLGLADVRVVHSLRGESAFSDGARERLGALRPGALIVTDLGVNAAGVLPEVPTLYVDHHRPEGEPDGAAVVSAYGWDPVPTSAWLAYELVSDLTDVEDLAWIAAVGTLGDLGDRAPWSSLPAIRKRYTAKWLKEAVSLINAARRSSRFDVDTPLRMLMELDHPRGVSENEELGADRLRAYRAEVNAELREARRAAPVFSRTEPLALIRFRSACQIHPLIAQQWRGRLPKYGVIAANDEYLPGEVAFSMRTARPDLNLLDVLRAVDLGEHNRSFGFGHDQATGGHLPPEVFSTLLAELGFDVPAGTESIGIA